MKSPLYQLSVFRAYESWLEEIDDITLESCMSDITKAYVSSSREEYSHEERLLHEYEIELYFESFKRATFHRVIIEDDTLKTSLSDIEIFNSETIWGDGRFKEQGEYDHLYMGDPSFADGNEDNIDSIPLGDIKVITCQSGINYLVRRIS